ncbi:MAG: MBL fold metallo-hydrolase [Rubrobacter sp.]|nr:MBL fold metallo-hydrolase [Rubrobacter sp.]
MAKKAAFETKSKRVYVLEDGLFITDAGNILGDTGGRKMRIRGAMHAVLIEPLEDNGELILLDAGFGEDIPERLEGRYELRREKSLMGAIEETGHTAEDVTHVVLSHLDPDHVGWAINPPSFPNATIYAQRAALEEARNMPEDDGRNLAVEPIERGVEEGWVELVDGDGEVAKGIFVEVRAGHSEGHQIVWIEDEALFTADLAPSKIFLDPDIIAGVDTDPEAARRNRIEVLAEAEKRDAPVILYHEPKDSVVKVRKSEKGFEATPVEDSE